MCPHFYFIRCWLFAPLSHIFKFFSRRNLGCFFILPPVGCTGNQLSGTIPAQISALVELESLYVHKLFANVSECWPLRLLSAFQGFFWGRGLNSNFLTGTIPPQISMLTKLSILYVPNLNQIIECWSYILLSVGPVCLSLTFSSFFLHRDLGVNALMGTIPSEISTLTKLGYLYAPSLIEVIECWSCFIEYWSCAPLSQPFKVFFLAGVSTEMP